MATHTSPLVLAHRGVSVEFPENTIAAFQAAGARGADGVELDVRRSADGQLVVHHDANLVDGRTIVDLPAASLTPDVPTLEQALVACNGLHVNIEIKNFPGEPDYDPDGFVARSVVELVRSMALVDDVIVSSFNYDDLMSVRSMGDDIATGWLVLDTSDVQGLIGHVVKDRHSALHPPVDQTTGALIDAAHAHGIRVNTWTVDDPERIVQLANDGVDAVITNDPATARAALDLRLSAE